MKNRRQLLRNSLIAGLVGGLSSLTGSMAFSKPRSLEGFQQQDWFFETSFDLQEDLKKAETNGKNLVLLWEQVGCHYCAKMHSEVFARQDIVALINQNFEVVQMDMRGNRKFNGLDGIVASEGEIARNLLVTGTPTTMFFDHGGDIVFRAPGYLKPVYFKALYQYVIDKAYEKTPFLQWIKTYKFN